MATLTPTHIVCIDPRNRKTISELPCTPLAEIPALAQSARTAQRAWAARPLAERKKAIFAWKQAILDEAPRIVATLAQEIGKPEPEAWTSEVLTANELFDEWCGQIDDLLAETPLDLNPINYPGKEIVVRPQARGLIGLIMPWNYPFHLPLRTMVPALLAGNAVIWKPSEHAALTAKILEKTALAALPNHLIQTLYGGGDQAQALIQIRPERIVFTGSNATSRKVALAAAEHLLEYSLESGSKDAAIVFADAVFERTVNGLVWGAFHNAGQDCAAVERVYVERSLYPRFVTAVTAATRALRPGLDVGPLITESAQNRVQSMISEAVAAGATLHCGGQLVGEGFGLSPAVLTELPDGCRLLREEIFGPVMLVMPFDKEEEAVAAVNGSEYGLCASIWTRDESRANRLIERLEVGSVFWNNCCFTGPMAGAAWSGRRQSGGGVTGSKFGLVALVQPQTVCRDSSRGAKELWWYPYRPALSEVAAGMVEISRKGGSLFVGAQRAVGGLLGRWKGE